MHGDDVHTRSSPARLRRGLIRAAERLGALEAERCALVGDRDHAEMDRRDLEGRLARTRRSLARMQAAVDACCACTAGLRAEAAAAGRDNRSLGAAVDELCDLIARIDDKIRSAERNHRAG